MKLRVTIRALPMLLVALPLLAQQPAEQEWRLQGSVGLDLSKISQTTLTGAGPSPTADYNSAAGDLRMDMTGYWRDPELLPFSLNFAEQHGSHSAGITGFHDNLLDFGVDGTFLPVRPFPLRVYYQKSQFAANGNTFGENSDTSSFLLDWTVREKGIPRINVGYNRYTVAVVIPTSLSNANLKQSHAYLNASDTWKQWEWSGVFDNYDSTSNVPSGLGPTGNFTETLRILNAHAHRSFWSGKADIRLEDLSQWLNETFPGQSLSTSSDTFNSVNLRVQHTQKLSTSYSYIFDRSAATNAVTNIGTNVSLLLPPTFISHYADGRVDYKLTSSINIFEDVRYQHVSPQSMQTESRVALTESLSGVGAHRSWHGFDASGVYVGHFQELGTNFGNHTHTWSNDVQGRVSKGDIQRVRVTAMGNYSKQNLVDELNGFAQDSRVGVELESTALPGFHARFTVAHHYIELLNLSGDTSQTGTDLSAQIEHRRISLGYVHTISDGAGALFPGLLQHRQLITIPLPLDQLVFTPLLNRNAHIDSALVILRLVHNLDLNGDWRQERDLLTNSNFYFRQLESYLRYRLGKFTIDAGYGSYRDRNFTSGTAGGLRTNRYILRVARDFRIF